MAEVVISKTTAGLKDGEYALIGKLNTPLKMYIMNESNAAAKKDGPAKWLCHASKTDKFAESAVSESRMAGLFPVEEGADAPTYGRNETDKAVIETVQFMRSEIITASDIEDSHGKVSASMQRQMKRMVNDYYVARNNLAAWLMANGTKNKANYNGVELKIGAPNGDPLFFKEHPVGNEGDVHSNILYSQRPTESITKEYVEGMMSAAVSHMLLTPGNDGQPLGYVPDIMVVSAWNPELVKCAKQAIGSEYTDNGSGQASNGINIQRNNWSLVVLPRFITSPDAAPIIFLSSAAAENLGGNVLLDRIPYYIHDWIEGRSMNYCWTGRTRMGAGHFSYKHALLMESLAPGVTTLYDGQTAADAATLIKL